jgi:DNA polymerase III alpha subunit
MTEKEGNNFDTLGLLKFDFLGHSNLTILRHAVVTARPGRGYGVTPLVQ